MAIWRICAWRSKLKFAQIVFPSVLTGRKCVYYRAVWVGQLPTEIFPNCVQFMFRVLRKIHSCSSQNISDNKTKGSAICLVRAGWYWDDKNVVTSSAANCFVCVGMSHQWLLGLSWLTQTFYSSSKYLLGSIKHNSDLPGYDCLATC